VFCGSPAVVILCFYFCVFVVGVVAVAALFWGVVGARIGMVAIPINSLTVFLVWWLLCALFF
jgi:hypothetical protein